MDYGMAPLKMTLAGIRLTGYMIETQCRVAQVLAQAALDANPYRIRKPIAARQTTAARTATRGSAHLKTAHSHDKKAKRQPSTPPAMPCGKTTELRPS